MNTCLKPKSSFLIDDILQESPPKTDDERLDAGWLARPTPTYLNQIQPLHPANLLRVPTLTTPATRDVYLSDGLITDERLRIHEYPYRHSELLDPIYRGNFILYYRLANIWRVLLRLNKLNVLLWLVE
ncbi:hypothetical protein L9F63_005024 [Diploptera punctata]|uniref:Uncharacterized protein n=1 Tax=Diploptera punctata TaxID=6984 RepID=A0AAD7ZDK6_DIPPU|nr:hypothetical protein L9F63_005024 [Diploptera punctata]